MSTRLLGGDERGAHPHARGARGERCGQPPTGGDATGGEHRHLGADRIEDVEQQRPQGTPAVESTTTFDAAHDQQVDARVDRRSCVVDRADLPTTATPCTFASATSFGSGLAW